MSKKIIVLGTAHLATTPGKCAPDGSLKECEYSREIVKKVAARLRAMGYSVFIDYEPLQPDSRMRSSDWKTEQNNELNRRVTYVNTICKGYGAKNVLYVSIHVNAAGSGKEWMQAGGWCAYTTVGKTESDTLAECLYDAAERHLYGYAQKMEFLKANGVYSSKQKPFRTDKADGDRDLESNFYVLRKTSCPAVLTENLFQDNKADVEFLLSEYGKTAIAQIHIDGILKYMQQ